ncbi:cation diffusion facilitator family transporter [Paenibacillus chitinolyticus]|uniref:Cation diffusion facilitator family transporter n=1 Tax=Paenibacillus chitinolyticus TaxID=79263 RepID=A0ABT4FHX3_9BACL|nr:cation diffusion facilitator family transporter [Paenibacillus chitinolyticus]MCY9589892.1 cation diffusion facilitator family transporter [Paenibacillus chitinolyticus]MCY9598107.1 cation diffusion facilitator family transporter [Paenibacillus chitinolyticus]
MNSSKIAFLSVFSNTFVTLLKLIVGIVTGSVAVISEAIHSALDLVASLIAFFSVRLSGRSADKNHPYGHGKVENISGTIETLLIFVAGIWIIYECVHKILNPTIIELPFLGIIVMVVGAGINFIVSRKVKKAADEFHSVAMKSNALHLLTDVFSSLGVAVSLLLVTLTGWTILDPIIGIVLALYIMREAYKLMKESFPPLLDARLTEEEESEILRVIELFKERYIEVHDLRTRRSGPEEYVDFHLVTPSTMDVLSAHQLCDEIEQAIKAVFEHAQVMIHVEPDHERLGNQPLSL